MSLLSALSLACLVLGVLATGSYIVLLLRARPRGAAWTEVQQPSGKLKLLSFAGFLLILGSIVLNFLGSAG